MARRGKDPVLDIFANDKTKAAFKSVQGNLKMLKAGAGALAGAFAIGLGVTTLKRLVQAADNVNALRIRVNTAVKDTGHFNEVWGELRDISQDVGSEMRTAVSTFQDLARVKVTLRATDKDMLQLTRTVNQLGVIAGSTTEQMRFGMRQFNQAMSQPMFRAEEFNSILENIPEVAARIAQGMDTNVGVLRNLVLEGKLASKDVFKVLMEQSEEISQQFNTIPLTLQRATANLQTAFTTGISKLDRMLQVSTTLADVFDRMAEAFNPTKKGTKLSIVELVGDIKNAEIDLEELQAGLAQRVADNENSMITKSTSVFDMAIEQKKASIAELRNEYGELLLTFRDIAGNINKLNDEPTPGGLTLGFDVEKLMEEMKTGASELKAQLSVIKKETDQRRKQEIAEALGFINEFSMVENTHKLRVARAAFATEKMQKMGFQSQMHEVLFVQRLELEAIDLEQELSGFTSKEERERAHKARLQEIEIEHWARIRGISGTAVEDLKQAAVFQNKWDQANSKAKVRLAVGALTEITAGMAGSSKKMFKINKALALGTAVVDGYQAIQAAWKSAPYPANLAIVALTTAKTLANVQRIKSTSFGGGGGGGGSATGTASGIPSRATLPPPDFSGVSEQSGQRIVLNITGDVYTQDGDEFAQKVVDAITEFTDADGIIINAGVAQDVAIAGVGQ